MVKAVFDFDIKSPIFAVQKVIDKLDIPIIFENDGVRIRDFDCSHFVIGDLFIPKTSLHEYEFSEREVVFVDFDDLKRVLKNQGKNRIEIATIGDKIRLKNINLKGIEKTYEFMKVDNVYDEIPEPNIDFTVKAELRSDTFLNSLKELSEFSDVIGVKVNGKLTMSGETETGKIDITLSDDELLKLKVNGDNITSHYGLDILKTLIDTFKLTETVKLYFAQKKPMKIITENDYYKFTYYIAPRVIDE